MLRSIGKQSRENLNVIAVSYTAMNTFLLNQPYFFSVITAGLARSRNKIPLGINSADAYKQRSYWRTMTTVITTDQWCPHALADGQLLT